MMEKSNKISIKVIVVIALLIIVAIVFILILPNLYKEDRIDVKEVQNIEKEKKSTIIYVYSGNDKACLKCREYIKYLNKKKLNYKLYDASKVEDEEYKSFLKSLHIDTKTFSYPALLYIKEGKIYSYIMNIKNEEIMDKFVNDYNLTMIK